MPCWQYIARHQYGISGGYEAAKDGGRRLAPPLPHILRISHAIPGQDTMLHIVQGHIYFTSERDGGWLLLSIAQPFWSPVLPVHDSLD